MLLSSKRKANTHAEAVNSNRFSSDLGAIHAHAYLPKEIELLPDRATGTYVIEFKLARGRNIQVGALGKIEFSSGSYYYIGSALNGLKNRIRRHLLKRKKRHWHIDYLLAHAEIEKIYIAPGNSKKNECETAEQFSKREHFQPVPRFGSSDCRCPSHLYYNLPHEYPSGQQ